eukprot:gene5356-5383_t
MSMACVGGNHGVPASTVSSQCPNSPQTAAPEAPSEFIVWGVGELGRFFSGAALRMGMRVTPIIHSTDPMQVLDDERQNEHFPPAWEAHPQIGRPTVCVVWAVVKVASSAVVSPAVGVERPFCQVPGLALALDPP